MEIELVELAQLLLNFNASQWDANANNKRVAIRVKANTFELVSIDRDHNGYENELILFTQEYLPDLLNQMRWYVNDKFKRDKMY